MDRRKEELERKRQKLAELRKAKEERNKTVVDTVTNRKTSEPPNSSGITGKEVDDLLESLGRPKVESEPPKEEVAPVVHHEEVKKEINFGFVEAVLLDIEPINLVTYSKEIQTDIVEEKEVEIEEKKEIIIVEPLAANQPVVEKEEQNNKKSVLNEEDIEHLIHSEGFSDFFDKTSKLVEKALNQISLKDYGLDISTPQPAANQCNLIDSFYVEKLCHGRCVTGLDFHSKHKELFLASYNKQESDGLVCIWNLMMKNRPEYTFYSQSDVLSCIFSPFHPHLLVGGTYSGQLLVWDMRSRAQPVLKTPLSVGHTHPVYSLKMVGSSSANHLMSASTDGLMCSWQLDMMGQPQEILELTFPTHPKTDEVAITCMDFVDTSLFLVGTEEGRAYQGSRVDRAGSKAGLHPFDSYQGHAGPITSISCHSHPDASNVFLTSGMDWTVKLWKSLSLVKPSQANHVIEPVHTFEGLSDAVTCLSWHPKRPNVFANVTASGALDIWDWSVDTQIPTATVSVSEKALNTLAWDRNEGNQIAVGGTQGKCSVYNLMPDLVQIKETSDWKSFRSILGK